MHLEIKIICQTYANIHSICQGMFYLSEYILLGKIHILSVYILVTWYGYMSEFASNKGRDEEMELNRHFCMYLQTSVDPMYASVIFTRALKLLLLLFSNIFAGPKFLIRQSPLSSLSYSESNVCFALVNTLFR